MRRFSLIGRLGPDDNDEIKTVQSDSADFEIDFLDGNRRMGYGIGKTLEQLSSLGLRPSELGIDLIVLAALVNAGDTRMSRKANAQDGWTREIDLYVPVSDPSIWMRSEQDIGEMLGFLTGDRWRVFFRGRTRRTLMLAPPAERHAVEKLTCVSLLSGGLDSLVGAIDLLVKGERPLFVSHYWDGETSKAQNCIFPKLQKNFGSDSFRKLRARIGFDINHLATGEKENTQRGRSFLFYSLATFAASALERPMTVNIPENGLIALNVPLDPLRFGALSTRTAHPHFIASLQKLITDLGLDVRLVNNYRHMTKGEMVEKCADKPFLRHIVANTMSCSSPIKATRKKLSPRHCGHCVPCLIRRASLKSGLGERDKTEYTINDLKAQTLATDRAEGEHVRAFQLMANRLEKTPEHAKYLVRKPGTLGKDPAEISAYADVFRRGILEVAQLLKGVKAKPGG